MQIRGNKVADGDRVEDKLISEWIECFSGFRDGVHIAGNISINRVGREGDAQDNSCNGIAFGTKALRNIDVRNAKRESDTDNTNGVWDTDMAISACKPVMIDGVQGFEYTVETFVNCCKHNEIPAVSAQVFEVSFGYDFAAGDSCEKYDDEDIHEHEHTHERAFGARPGKRFFDWICNAGMVEPGAVCDHEAKVAEQGDGPKIVIKEIAWCCYEDNDVESE